MEQYINLKLSYFFIAFLALFNFVVTLPQVEIRQGVIVGQYKTSYRNRTFSAFEGIPFAEPPVGKLRFKEPVPAGAWDGVLFANKSYICPTYKEEPNFYVYGTEDCLYIYVYVPKTTIDKTDNYPVVAYIHGGGFFFGSPLEVAKPDYMMDQDVILVTFNYRLGILGLLSTEDEVLPGNNGLKDQSLALTWIKENIKTFGGNPDSVTLFGISSGGSCVHLHYLSPWSKGLFHKGYSSSGVAIADFAIQKNALVKTKRLAADSNCTTASTIEMVECLRNVPWDDLMRNSLKGYAYSGTFTIPEQLFGPVVENNPKGFLPGRPIDLMLSRNDLYDIPWITSVTKDEGIPFLSSYVKNNMTSWLGDNWLTDIGAFFIGINDTVDDSLKTKVLTEVRDYYFGNKSMDYSNVDIFIQMQTDRFFFVPGEQAIKIQSVMNSQPVYFFMFSFLPEHYIKFKGLRPGVCHATDEQLYFKIARVPDKLAPREEQEMIVFTTFLANYALTGIPIIENMPLKPINPKNPTLEFLEVVGPGEFNIRKVKHISPSYDFWTSLPISDTIPSNSVGSGTNLTQNNVLIGLTIMFIVSLRIDF